MTLTPPGIHALLHVKQTHECRPDAIQSVHGGAIHAFWAVMGSLNVTRQPLCVMAPSYPLLYVFVCCQAVRLCSFSPPLTSRDRWLRADHGPDWSRVSVRDRPREECRTHVTFGTPLQTTGGRGTGSVGEGSGADGSDRKGPGAGAGAGAGRG